MSTEVYTIRQRTKKERAEWASDYEWEVEHPDGAESVCLDLDAARNLIALCQQLERLRVERGPAQ